MTARPDGPRLKWHDLVTPGTPLPTPWDKEKYEARSREIQAERARLRAAGAPEAEMDRLFASQKAWETALLSSMTYSGALAPSKAPRTSPRACTAPRRTA